MANIKGYGRRVISINEPEFLRLSGFMQSRFGIQLTNKERFIEGRLGSLLYEQGYSAYGEYFDHVFSDATGRKVSELVDRLTTNHTYFMREEEHFNFYREQILPEIYKNSSDRDLRVWSAGCSTGQEAYSIAMVNSEFFGAGSRGWDTRILATDLCETALGRARAGVYTMDEASGLSPMFRLKYCSENSDKSVSMTNEIKNNVIFRKLNLKDEFFPFKRKFHVIFCRNVMIYFDSDTRAELIKKFYEVTSPGGYLFIGHSEAISRDAANYKYIKPAIYRKEE